MTIKGKTSSGFEFEIDSMVMDDMELVDALADTMNDNPLSFSIVCTKLFGVEQKKRLYNHLRKDGRVPLEAISNEIADVFKAMGEDGKNS